MRTSPTERSSTSGVFPTSSSSEGATTLGIPPPEVDRRAQLAEELVDAPRSRRGIRRDARLVVALDQFRLPPAESRQAEEVVARIPRPILDHPLAPLAAERRLRDEGQACGRRVMFDCF